MRYPPEKRRRRSIRLLNYDYTQPGAYFLTKRKNRPAGPRFHHQPRPFLYICGDQEGQFAL